MNMKLSYRDKVVFIVVIVILILVAGFFLLIKPKFEEIDSAKYNLETKQTEKENIDAKIATLPTIIEDMKAIARDVGDRQGIFMTEQAPYLNETYLREAFASQNLDITAFTTSYTTANNVNRYDVANANILAYPNKMTTDLYGELPQEVYDKYNNVSLPSYPTAEIGITSVSITFKSDANFNKAYNVIDRIASDEKTVLLNSVVLDRSDNSTDDKDIGLSITLYSINPLNVEKVLEETDEIKPIETPAE